MIDDYHPEQSRYEHQRLESTAQRVLRMYGDRVGRGRLKSTTDFQKEYPPRGMALVTGEEIPPGQSSVARFLAVELKSDDVDLETLTRVQSKLPLLREAMSGYIGWLAPQMDGLPSQLGSYFQKLRERFQKRSVHGRLGEAAAWLQVGFAMMLKYFVHLGVLEMSTAVKYRKKCESVLVELVQTQGQLMQSEKPSAIFVSTLKDLFDRKIVRVEPIKPTSRQYDSGHLCGTRIGWYDETFYYLLPAQVYGYVARELQKSSKKFPLSERMLWKALEQEEMIYVEVSPSDSKVQRCPKKTVPTGNAVYTQPKHEAQMRPRLLHLYRRYLETDDEI